MPNQLSLPALLLLLACACTRVCAQTDSPSHGPAEPFSRLNTFGLFAEYSNDSSHIFLGQSGQRKIASAGVLYERRLFRTRNGEFRYFFELRPAFEESDPVSTVRSYSYTSRFGLASSIQTFVPVACVAGRQSGSGTIYFPPNGIEHYTFTDITTCARRWTYAEGMEPAGVQWVFRRHHPVRPFVNGNAGVLLSTRPIPVENAGSFNFTFGFGAGLELYRTPHTGLQVEYRLHHISNNYTAGSNPGIDSSLFRLTYVFGR